MGTSKDNIIHFKAQQPTQREKSMGTGAEDARPKGSHLFEQLEDFAQATRQVEQELVHERNRGRKLETHYRSERKQLQGEINRSQQRIKQLETEKKRVENELHHYTKRSQDLNQQSTTYLQEIDTLKNELARQKQKNRDFSVWKQAAESLENEKRNLADNLLETKNQFSIIAKELNDEKKKKEHYQQQVNKLANVAEKNETAAKMRQQLLDQVGKRYAEENQKLKNEIRKINESLVYLNKSTKNATMEADVVRMEMRNEVAETITKIQSMMRELDRSLRNENQQIRDTLSESKGQHRQEMKAFVDRMTNLFVEIDSFAKVHKRRIDQTIETMDQKIKDQVEEILAQKQVQATQPLSSEPDRAEPKVTFDPNVQNQAVQQLIDQKNKEYQAIQHQLDTMTAEDPNYEEIYSVLSLTEAQKNQLEELLNKKD